MAYIGGYVIRRIDDGKFVTPSGSGQSYTKSLRGARMFDTREQAEGNCCGNERAVALADLLGGKGTR
jgi:hypothetical protein